MGLPLNRDETHIAQRAKVTAHRVSGLSDLFGFIVNPMSYKNYCSKYLEKKEKNSYAGNLWSG